MQDIALNNKIVAFYFRTKAITKKIIAQKQIITRRESFVA